jgi:glutamate dehydrogenase
MTTARKSPKTTASRAKAPTGNPGAASRTSAARLEPVLAVLRKRAPAARKAQAEAFARAFYKRMSEEELQQHSPEGWAALALDFFDMVRTRKPGTAAVRIFNPGMDKDGWESPHTVVQVANDDMPFLVDSVTMALADQGVGVHVLGHPVVQVGRDKAGKLVAAGAEAGGDAKGESLMHLEIDRQTQAEMPAIEGIVHKVLGDVRAAVADWDAMRRKMLAVADDLATRRMPVSDAGRSEAQEFLRWAADNHFTFLGYREYDVVEKGDSELLCPVETSGLGLLRGKDKSKPRDLRTLAAHYMPQSGSVDALILTKTNGRATVHRPGYMDYIGVLKFDEDGKPTAEQRFLGLYTSSAYSRRPWEIPLVRERHEHVMRHSGLTPDGHSGKALRHILESLPRDELFQSSEEELLRTATGILGLQERVSSKLFLRRDRYGRFWSALVYIPRDRFNTEVRRRIERMLREALNGDHVDTNVQVGESPLAQLHMIIRPRRGEAVEVDAGELEAELESIVRNWQDDLREALVSAHGEEKGLKLAHRYGRALPAGYIERVTPAVAAADVLCLSSLKGVDDLRINLYRAARNGGGLRLKFYRLGHDIPLSDALPMMENMGLRVITEHPFRIELPDRGGDNVAWIQDFEVEASNPDLNVDGLDASFEEAFSRLWHGDAENDGFNRLILGAGLTWRQVAMLRAYGKYIQQVGVPFSQAYVEETFNRYPLLARLLVELFEARFDPATGSESKTEVKRGQDALRQQLHGLAADEPTRAVLQGVVDARGGNRARQVEATRAALLGLLDRVASLDQDRILRSFIGCMDATLRTSYYIDYARDESGNARRADGGPADYLAFKLDSGRVPDAPKPRPYREIWVCGPRVEGVHLRFGPVARGGLRS